MVPEEKQGAESAPCSEKARENKKGPLIPP